jgi:hypothetical protein
VPTADPRVVLAAGEGAGLAAFLDRLLALEAAAAVRLQVSGETGGVWAAPPLGVYALRPLALEAPAQVDRTVAAARLRAAVEAAGGADGSVAVPVGVVGVAWAGVLPPRAGWEPGAVAPVATVRAAVQAAVAAYRRRATPEDPVAVQRSAAAEVWDAPGPGGAPVRAAHAAELLGLLGPPDGQVRVLRCGPWWRLACPGGSTLVRAGDAPGRLDLAALLG